VIHARAKSVVAHAIGHGGRARQRLARGRRPELRASQPIERLGDDGGELRRLGMLDDRRRCRCRCAEAADRLERFDACELVADCVDLGGDVRVVGGGNEGSTRGIVAGLRLRQRRDRDQGVARGLAIAELQRSDQRANPADVIAEAPEPRRELDPSLAAVDERRVARRSALPPVRVVPSRHRAVDTEPRRLRIRHVRHPQRTLDPGPCFIVPDRLSHNALGQLGTRSTVAVERDPAEGREGEATPQRHEAQPSAPHRTAKLRQQRLHRWVAVVWIDREPASDRGAHATGHATTGPHERLLQRTAQRELIARGADRGAAQ